MDNSKTASRQAARKRGLLINRDFTLLWSAQAISKLGDVVFDYTGVLPGTSRCACVTFWCSSPAGTTDAFSARICQWAPLPGGKPGPDDHPGDLRRGNVWVQRVQRSWDLLRAPESALSLRASPAFSASPLESEP